MTMFTNAAGDHLAKGRAVLVVIPGQGKIDMVRLARLRDVLAEQDVVVVTQLEMAPGDLGLELVDFGCATQAPPEVSPEDVTHHMSRLDKVISRMRHDMVLLAEDPIEMSDVDLQAPPKIDGHRVKYHQVHNRHARTFRRP